MNSKTPKPSKQELSMQEAQTALLNQQRTRLQSQYDQQNLLTPLMLKQAGVKAKYGTRLVDAQGNPWTPASQSPPREVQGIVGYEDMGPTKEQQAYNKLLDYQLQNAKYAQEQADFERKLMPLQFQQAGYTLQYDKDGKPSGVTMTPGGAADLQGQYLQSQLATGKQQEELNRLFLDRSQKAMRGELPVDPGMAREFDRSENVLRASLRNNLGAGYDTSTPGIQALAEFNQRKGDAIYAAQHGEIGSAAQLAMAGQQSGINPTTANPNALLGRAGTAGDYLGGFAGMGSPTARSAQFLSAVQTPFQGAGGFGTLAELYGQAGNQFMKNNLTYNQPGKNRAMGAVGGAMSGAALGTAIAPGYGTAIGAGAGALLGAFS